MEVLPKDHVRLLHISPGSRDQPIRCHVSVASIKNPPSYEALSYAWGDPKKNRLILCDECPLGLTQNLYDAVRYLRLADKERTMWIDAICIRQDDDVERTAQVRIMKDIYANASHVVIWLGPEEPLDEMTFSLLKQFADLFAKHGQQHFSDVENSVYGFGLPEQTSKEWIALVKFFRRPWFLRVWVIQEAVMAYKATVAFGSHTVSWDLICQITIAFRKSGAVGMYDTGIHCPGMLSTILVYHLRLMRESESANNWDLLGVLRLTRKYEATDLRDKVFALVGVGTNTKYISAEVQAVDYAMTTEEVYTSIAIHSLSTVEGLEVLSNAGMNPNSSSLNLPTWIPDWSKFNDHKSVINLSGQHVRFNATLSSTPIFSISSNKKVLTIRGAIIDTISTLNTKRLTIPSMNDDPTLPSHQKKTRLEWGDAIQSCIDITTTATRYQTDAGRREALWRTLCNDMTPLIPVTRAPPSYAHGFDIFVNMNDATDEEGNLDSEKIDKELRREHLIPSIDFFHAVLRATLGRTFGVTAGGFVGRFPKSSRIGDHICLLFGGRVPFLLRECGDGRFNLVGECYVHGIMDGLAMERDDIESLTRDFEII